MPAWHLPHIGLQSDMRHERLVDHPSAWTLQSIPLTRSVTSARPSLCVPTDRNLSQVVILSQNRSSRFTKGVTRVMLYWNATRRTASAWVG